MERSEFISRVNSVGVVNDEDDIRKYEFEHCGGDDDIPTCIGELNE